jgi:hypothetical protein
VRESRGISRNREGIHEFPHDSSRILQESLRIQGDPERIMQDSLKKTPIFEGFVRKPQKTLKKQGSKKGSKNGMFGAVFWP